MEASQYALVQGVRDTRAALAEWRSRPVPVLRRWLLGALAVAGLLLLAVWLIAAATGASEGSLLHEPPLFVGGPSDVLRIVTGNLLVLALHAMACVAGFIAGSSLPLQADAHGGTLRLLYERGRVAAIAFVVTATGFSLSWQAYALGRTAAHVALAIHASPGVLLLGLLPHALPELMALFLPLAAWMVASRKGEWDRLLAATFVTVGLAIPTLIMAALWEVFVAPHLLQAMFAYG